MRKSYLLITILFLVFVGLSVIRSIVSNGMSTSGTELGRMNDKIAAYETENVSLRERFFALSSLNLISSKAAEMGFVEEKKTFSLTRSVPIAAKQ